MVSDGSREVLRDAIEDVGDCIERIFDLVDRSFRRSRCGSLRDIEGHENGNLGTVKKRCVEAFLERAE